MLSPDTPLAEAGWFDPVAVTLTACAVLILVWRLWRAQQDRLALVVESARELAMERERIALARQENAELTRENKTKSEMLATLSRDIRGHLNGIMGSADLLLDNSLKPRQREHLATLRASAESLHQSLNDVVDYSNLETGQIKIAHHSFDLRQPLTDVIETVSPLALLKDLEVVLIVEPDVPLHVNGDVTRLRQVLLNLASNAVRFTPKGRVVVRAALSPGADVTGLPDGSWLHFSVTDNGPGIPEGMHAGIFDRPTNSAVGSPRNFGAAGLELAIVKRLVELMGGKIGVRGLPEGGSEFWFVLSLPVDKVHSTTTHVNLPGLHVVVLDGLAAARIAVSSVLARLGVDHDATDTVAQAIEMLLDAVDAEASELVLLVEEEIILQVDAELAQALAAEPALRDVRIVLMSRDPENIGSSSLALPVTAVLRKPLLRAEALLDALRAKPGGAIVPPPSGSRPPFGAAPVKPAGERRPRVLVVDDDNISRSVSSQLLAILGCEVELAVSGAAAIERAAAAPFEIIFMDCQMPEMDGYEATRRIIAAAGGKAPPIIAVTANTSPRDRDRSLAAGMSDFIPKPVKKTDLARAVKQWAR